MVRVGGLERFTQKINYFVARGPAYIYTYGRWRVGSLLQKLSTPSFEVDQVALLAGLDLDKATLRTVKVAVEKDDDQNVVAELTAYFRQRNTPCLYGSDDDREETILRIPDHDKSATIEAANDICHDTYNFRGVGPVRFENGIDWTYQPDGNIDWTWDLNRHAYFETLGRAYAYTGDEQYAAKFKVLLHDWLAANPVGLNQPNWKSVFEVAFRINSWIWAFYHFRSASAFDEKTCLAFLTGLLTHGRFLDAGLELHVPNNHLLLEAKALVLLGLLFPEFEEAKAWRDRGLRILDRQIQAQVCADGVHAERSTHYHRVIAGELLELLIVMENNGYTPPSEWINSFERMVEVELWMTKPDGLIPLFGDSALVDTYMRFSAAAGGPIFLKRFELSSLVPAPDETTCWLLGANRFEAYQKESATPVTAASRAFGEGGYFVMRAGQAIDAAYLAFDCGPFGYNILPNHGHADALSFELYALGQTLLVDPGVYSTSLGENWRNFFRGTQAHNTVVVDGQDQSVLMDVRRVHRPAQARLHQWLTSEQIDFVDGSHNGYERLAEPITHRRQIFFLKPEYWVVIDVLTGRGAHCFDLYFHLMPASKPHLDEKIQAWHTGTSSRPGLSIVPLSTSKLQAELFVGATDPIQGWVSFYSGQKEPAPTLRYRQEGTAPVQFCTVLYPRPAGVTAQVRVLPLEIDIEASRATGNSELTSLLIEANGYHDLLMVDRGPVGVRKRFAGYQTDAQLIYIRRKKETEELENVVMQGGHHLLFQGRSLLGTEETGANRVHILN